MGTVVVKIIKEPPELYINDEDNPISGVSIPITIVPNFIDMVKDAYSKATQDWKSVKAHAEKILAEYNKKCNPGCFGAKGIEELLNRLAGGERSEELYSDLRDIEYGG